MDKINNREEYIQLFSKKQKEALKQAIDNRRFEIELYWKRATYFWTILAAAFAGYLLVQKAGESFSSDVSLMISLLGLAFSLCWYRVNRGGKYWLRNWDRHVEILEDEVIGPLHKTLLNPDKLSKFMGAAPYSVTATNEILSFFVVFVWIYLVIRSVCPSGWSTIRLVVLLLIVLLWLLLLFIRGKIVRFEKPVDIDFVTRGYQDDKDNVTVVNEEM